MVTVVTKESECINAKTLARAAMLKVLLDGSMDGRGPAVNGKPLWMLKFDANARWRAVRALNHGF